MPRAVDGPWTPWTPWSECSASCGPGRQRRYRFCSAHPGVPCAEPQPQERPCARQPCHCECPELGVGMGAGGNGDGGHPVLTAHSPTAPDCAAVPGSVFSHCGPPCPRSCDDISVSGDPSFSPSHPLVTSPALTRVVSPWQHCVWHCQPGCYCTNGTLLDATGTACVALENCTCLDAHSGQRHQPGQSVPRGDGCNNW